MSLTLAGELLCEDPDSRLGIDAGTILVSYMDESGPVVLEGRETSEGIFELHARSRPRRATLAFSDDLQSLAGEWRERGDTGAWRVDLA